MKEITTDVLVIGGGLAALRAAVAAAEEGARVVVAGKGIVGRSGNTVISSAGVAGYLPDPAVEDSPAEFFANLLDSGRQINDKQLARVLAEEAGAALTDCQRFGVTYLTAGGGWDRVRVPGHSRPRSFRAAPWQGSGKGLGLTLPLQEFAERLGVELLHTCPVVDLATAGGRVTGALAVNLGDSTPVRISCGAVIIATGGCAYLYARTNGTRDVNGDGIALALRAGAPLRDMEFVQFHPTRIDEPAAMLLSDGLCADGAILRDRNGREFLYDYHPMGSMAPRDVRAWAIFKEMEAGNGVDGGVFLDCSGIPMERLELRHAPLLKVMRAKGWDFPASPLVTSPAAHFLMGGVAAGVDGETCVKGLFVAGETVGGAHGANRLGSTGLSEALVTGARAGRKAAGFARAAGAGAPPGTEPLLEGVHAGADSAEPALVEGWRRLRDTMWQFVALSRSGQGMSRAVAELRQLRSQLEQLKAPDLKQWAKARELLLAMDTAEAIALSSLHREESRGAHRREDFPEETPAWLGNIYISRQEGALTAEFRPLSAPPHPQPAAGVPHRS